MMVQETTTNMIMAWEPHVLVLLVRRDIPHQGKC